jgi:hypothetical protein
MATKVYAVRRGIAPGIYATWAECEAQVRGISGAEYKGFKSESEARAWLGEYTQTPPADVAPTSQEQASAQSADLADDTNPCDVPEEELEATPVSSAQARSPVQGTAPPAAPQINYRQQLAEKAAAFLAFLREQGVAAYAASGGSQYHERIGIEGGGWVDLYHTRRKGFDLIPGRFEDPFLWNSLDRLWLAFRLAIAKDDEEPLRSPWDTVDHYYVLLLPYAKLRFDFIALARALHNAAPDAPDPDAIRYDFDQIEAAYRQLRPETK